jgi:hypothetical protein
MLYDHGMWGCDIYSWHLFHHHLSFMVLGHLLTRSGLTCPEASSKVCHDSYCRSGSGSHSGITVSPGMEEMPSLNTPVQSLKLAILPLDSPCSGPVTHSGEILTTGKSHRKKLASIWKGWIELWKLVRKLVSQSHVRYLSEIVIMFKYAVFLYLSSAFPLCF